MINCARLSARRPSPVEAAMRRSRPRFGQSEYRALCYDALACPSTSPLPRVPTEVPSLAKGKELPNSSLPITRSNSQASCWKTHVYGRTWCGMCQCGMCPHLKAAPVYVRNSQETHTLRKRCHTPVSFCFPFRFFSLLSSFLSLN